MGNKLATYYWSRAPGKFVNKLTGEEYSFSEFGAGPVFHGTVREWYETLAESISDAANKVGAKDSGVVLTSPDILTIIEHMVGYKPASVGQKHLGTLHNRWKIFRGPVKSNQLFVSATQHGDFVELHVLDMVLI